MATSSYLRPCRRHDMNSFSDMLQLVSTTRPGETCCSSFSDMNSARQHNSASDPDSYGNTSPRWVVPYGAPYHATGNCSLLSSLHSHLMERDDLGTDKETTTQGHDDLGKRCAKNNEADAQYKKLLLGSAGAFAVKLMSKDIFMVNMGIDGGFGSKGASATQTTGGNHQSGTGLGPDHNPYVILDTGAEVSVTGDETIFKPAIYEPQGFDLRAANGNEHGSFSKVLYYKLGHRGSSHNSIIQVVLSALKRFCNTFASVVSMVLRYVFVVATILCSSASESPSAVTMSKFNYSKGIRRDTELTKNESQHHSDPDSYGKTSPRWVVSSAAPHHATGNRALLSRLVTKHGDTFVHAVDEMPMPVVAHGTAVSDEVDLPNVWLVPGLTANMVSVCQLVEMDYSVEFGGGMCYIRNSSDGTVIGKAQLRKGGVYVLDFLKVPLGV